MAIECYDHMKLPASKRLIFYTGILSTWKKLIDFSSWMSFD